MFITQLIVCCVFHSINIFEDSCQVDCETDLPQRIAVKERVSKRFCDVYYQIGRLLYIAECYEVDYEAYLPQCIAVK